MPSGRPRHSRCTMGERAARQRCRPPVPSEFLCRGARILQPPRIRSPRQVDLDYARGPDGTLRVALGGDWSLARGIPAPGGVIEEIERSPLPSKVVFDTAVLAGWDSGLLTFLVSVLSRCSQLGIEADRQGLPVGVRRLLALATAVP